MTNSKRQIKFRIWDKKTKQFVTGYEDRCGYDEFYSDPPGIFFAGLRRVQADEDYVLQQSTGLLDAGEREIYEGDIVKTGKGPEIIGQVVFLDGAFSVWMGEEFYYLNLVCERKAMIVGNIF